MYLEDIEAPQDDRDVTHSCIFAWPDRPPLTLPPAYIPPGGPPDCHPYCELEPPEFEPPDPPEEPPGNYPPGILPPGTYPPGDFLVPKNRGNYHSGDYFLDTYLGPSPPLDYASIVPTCPPLPAVDTHSFASTIKASQNTDAGILCTPDGTGHGFFVNYYQGSHQEYGDYTFDMQNFSANLQQARLVGTITTSYGPFNITESIEIYIPTGVISTFQTTPPPPGLHYVREQFPFFSYCSQSSSVVYEFLEVTDIPL